MKTKQETGEQIAARMLRGVAARHGRKFAASLCLSMASQLSRPLRWKVAYTEAARILSK